MFKKPVFVALVLFLPAARAAVVAIGSAREEVVAVLGEPVGRSSAGSREVLSYSGGRVFLRDGKVEAIDAALLPAAPEPAPVQPAREPGPAPVAAAPVPAVPPAPVPAPPAAGGNWIKLAGLTVFLGVVFLLGRHWIREARRAQEAKRRDQVSR